MDRNNPDDMNDEPINNGNVHPISAPLTVMVPPLSVIVPPLPPPSMINADILARNRANMVNQYMQMSDGNYDMDSIPPPKADFSAPPPYDVAANCKLPTYEEVQQEKHMQGETQPRLGVQQPPPLTTFLAIETVEAPPEYEADSGLLGTDFMFCTAFFVAFLFNWIGFLLLMCFCHTIASRYGALSGFGLSLAKWTLIVKHSTELASHDNSWLCWLIMAFGILICIRAIIQYLHIKRGWRLLSGTAQERLLFFH